MVKLKGPGLSAGASGTLAGTLTFGKLRRTSTLRKKPTPKQPRSGLQVSMRAMMKFLSQQWTNISAVDQATWLNAYADPQLNNYNSYIRHNLERWRSLKAPSKAFPAAEVAAHGMNLDLACTGHVRHTISDARYTLSVMGGWTIMLYHLYDAIPDVAVQYLVHVYLAEDTAHHLWTHTPLIVGDHIYRASRGTFDGGHQLTPSPIDTATVT